MFRTKLAVVISSVLLASVATQAQPAPTDQVEATSPAQSSAPAEASAPQDADASTGGNEPVGSEESNVDEHATSGSYYPYSAGTAGDDPSEPKETAAPANAGAKASGSTDQWQNADTDGDGYLSQDELTKVAPALADNFDDIDVDNDKKLTRGEFRTWHESQKARMDADEGTNPTASPAAPQEPTSAPPSTVPTKDADE